MDQTWVGIDAGKEFHRAHVMDACGVELLSRRVENDEADLLRLIEEVLSLAGRSRLTWAIDQPGGGAALLLALLWERDQRGLYIPGLTIDRARDAYRGESKTDAKDAYVIADQSRMRSDLSELAPSEGKSPRCSSCSPADAISSPTRAGPSPASERRSFRCSRPSSAPWISTTRAISPWW